MQLKNCAVKLACRANVALHVRTYCIIISSMIPWLLSMPPTRQISPVTPRMILAVTMSSFPRSPPPRNHARPAPTLLPLVLNLYPALGLIFKRSQKHLSVISPICIPYHGRPIPITSRVLTLSRSRSTALYTSPFPSVSLRTDICILAPES